MTTGQTTLSASTESAPILTAHSLVRRYRDKRGKWITAVDHVSFELKRGEVLGIVGESGCGKSSLAKALLMLPPPDDGQVVFLGRDLTRMGGNKLRAMRPHIQAVFQDPIASLNPRHTIYKIVEAPLLVHGVRSRQKREERVAMVLREVGLDMSMHGHRRPHELSGGQCQRVSIARALVLRPDVLVCDEPVSALDVSVQAQVINLLEEIRRNHGLSILFISHDLAVVRALCDRVMVMLQGGVCEIGPTGSMFDRPCHPYTAELLAAVPHWDTPASRAQVRDDDAEIDGVGWDGRGCFYRSRCPRAGDRCVDRTPVLSSGQHGVACHDPLNAADREERP